MKAAIFEKYGPPEVLKVKEINKPTPKNDEVLIKVVNCAVTSADCRIRGANFPKGFTIFARLMFGLFAPRNKVLGSSFSGIIEEIGLDVTKFKVGDEVFGLAGIQFGVYAEYLAIKESKPITKKPTTLTFEEAAALSFGGSAALYFVRNKAKVNKGQKVLVNGASGAVGTNAVQLAKYFGAEVTAVCSSENIDLVKSLGADEAIDYTKEDISKGNVKYDVIFDTVGTIPIKKGLQLLAEDGVLVLVVAGLLDMFTLNKKIINGTAPEKTEDLEYLARLVEDKKLKVVVDKTYALEDVVEAHTYASSGHKKGNIVLEIG